MLELSVLIPSYLEEENLRLLLPRLQLVLHELGCSSEILVIDCMQPKDGTGSLCKNLGVGYLVRTGSDSYGSAVRTGIANSKGKYIIFMDADGSHAPEFIRQLYSFANKADVVIASRYVGGGATENPEALIWMSRFLNILYTVFLGINCKDISNSFKLYRGDILRSLCLNCENFDIVEEILVRYAAKCKNIRIKELPFVFKKRMFGQTKRNLPLFIFSFGITLIRLSFIRYSSALLVHRKFTA